MAIIKYSLYKEVSQQIPVYFRLLSTKTASWPNGLTSTNNRETHIHQRHSDPLFSLSAGFAPGLSWVCTLPFLILFPLILGPLVADAYGTAHSELFS